MIRPTITRVRLVTMTSEVDTRTLTSEFPSLKVERAHAARVDDAIIDTDEWRRATSFEPFDDVICRSHGDALMVRGDRHVELVACETLTRYQRFVQRRNGSSRTRAFEHVLRAHRALSSPLATNDFDQALDTWQWMLRLDPAATLTAQLAALFYVAVRGRVPEDAPVAPVAPDAPAHAAAPATPEAAEPHPPLHSETHLRAGQPALVDADGLPLGPTERDTSRGAWDFDVLATCGVPESIVARVREIVSLGERRGRDTEMDLLSDASALSFLSLGSPMYLDAFGPETTRKKLGLCLSRMGDLARTKLALVRLRPDVRTLCQRAVAA